MTSNVPSIDLGADTNLFGELFDTWRKRRRGNIRRSVYYDGEQALKDFGISLPPEMAGISAALGWIGKGVNARTDRSQFEGFVTLSGGDDPLGLEELMWENQFETEFPAACVSSAMHGCSFLTVTNGDLESGEPDVLVMARDAESSAAVWDKRRRELGGFLSILATSDTGEPTEMALYTFEQVLHIVKRPLGWRVTSIPHPMGEVPAYPLVHGYELRRPLGHSRITKPSMYFADAALRTIVRSEVSAEFYSAPEYWLFGAEVKNFVGNDRWTAIMGRIKAKDVDTAAGEQFPKIERFTGESPLPHSEQLRMFATQFADEMDLDVRYADSANPSSAEAIFAAKESLITGTKKVNRLWGHGAVRAMNAGIRLRDGLDADTAEMRGLRAQFTDPMLVSPQARADSFSKFASNVPGFAETEVGLEIAGLSREQIQRFRSEQRRKGVALLTERLNASPAAGGESLPGEEELAQAQIAKARADALGAFRRAGVEEKQAAELAGIAGEVKFIPGAPITIRAPEPGE